MTLRNDSSTHDALALASFSHLEVLRIYLTSASLYTLRQLRASCRTSGLTYSEKTLRRILNRYLFRCYTVRGLCLTPRNLQLRQQFASNVLKDPARFAQVLFTDEKLFVIGQKCPQVAWKTATSHRNRVPFKRFGGTRVMVWGCMSLSGIGTILRVPYASDGTVTAEVYARLLQDVAIPLAQQNGLIFQHDNARCHTACGPASLLAQSVRVYGPWPPNSPDFSPVEQVWARMQGYLDDLMNENIPFGMIQLAFDTVRQNSSLRTEMWLESVRNITYSAHHGGRQL